MNKLNSEPLTGEELEATTAPKRNWKRLLLMLVVPLLLLGLGGYWWLNSGKTVTTDNATVKQDITSIGAQVSGPILEVFVREGDRVKAGQLLFRIDPAPYRVALAQAEAQLAAAQLAERQAITQAAGTSADITGAQNQLEIARRALGRQSQLLQQGFTTRVSYDEALADVRRAETALADAGARAANAHAAIVPSGEQPGEAAARAAIARARLDLSRTDVRAPAAGVISNADRLLAGQQVVPGIGMVSLVGGEEAWVEANFKEGDLARMAPGQRVEIEIDAYGGKTFTGRVQSIGAGTGSEFAILPAQNANGNWVKVTQRVPVRIRFDRKPDQPMIAGLSATVTVDLNG
jgi:membrane fusion protein (multidrug efflux system)